MGMTVQAAGYATWVATVGEVSTSRAPVVCAAGGPGASWDYLRPLEGLADRGRQVVFYDQVGCGRSEGPTALEDHTIDLYVRQLFDVASALQLDAFHLLGHSWGGMFGLEVALTGRRALSSLVLVSGYPATQPVLAELGRLRRGLEVDPGDEDAEVGVFMAKHFCRDASYLQWMFTELPPLNVEVYEYMWGPSEFECTGTLRDWDVRDRLANIEIPVLVTGGRHDEITPAIHEATHHAMTNSRLVIFEESSHMSFAEETRRFLAVVSDFLDEVDGVAGGTAGR